VLNASGILEREDFEYVPSYTTRDLRPGEVNGVKYHHITEGEFEQAIMREEFLEHATYALNMYGTKTASVMDVLSQ
jgi:guanylate kinase